MNIGIWIDKKEAKLVRLTESSESINVIQSNIEDFHPKGGSGSKQKGGPQDVVQDSKYLEREKHQLKDFFKEISHNLSDAESIVIFGPAQTGKKLHTELSESYPQIHAKVAGLRSADSMTDNQIKAWARDFFSE